MRSALVVCSFIAAGCASASSAPSSAPADRVIAVDDRVGATVRAPNDVEANRVTLPATADQVYAAVTSSYAMLKVPITYFDKSLGEQGNRKFVMSRTFDNQRVSTYLNCGDDPFGGPNANANPVTVSLVTRAKAVGGTSTVLETTLSGVTYKGGGNSGPIYCGSTGALEQHIAAMVASRLTRDQ